MRAPDWLTARPIAHRGFHDMNNSVYENTLTAFARAVEAGFAIECDLQYAADGVPMVFHDGTLDRLCTLKGSLRDRLSSDLAQMAIGGTKDRIPSVPQLLDLVAGKVPLVIELKGCKGDDEGFTGAVLEALEGYGGPVALMSFDTWLLDELAALEAPMPLGLTACGTQEADFERHRAIMKKGLSFVSYDYHHLPNPFVDEEKAKGTAIITWTVRDAEGRAATRAHGDQMTFEGFDPRTVTD